MKKLILIQISVLLTLPLFSQYVLEEGFIDLPNVDLADENYTYKNLALYPIVGEEMFRNAHSDIKQYTPLEKALKSGQVVITESSEGGSVNQLYIENLSAETVYLMAGEVVKGGKQDRVISDDMLLMPHSGKIDLNVFCVEHHRWSYKSDRNFNEYYSVSSNSVRKKAAVDKDQSGVWQKVDEVTRSQNAATSTGTYTALKNSDEYNDELRDYTNHFIYLIGKVDNCIGFVGVSGGKIIGCDIFATHDLFKKQMNNLISSYSTEAIAHGKKVSIGYDEVKKYLSDFLSDERNQDAEINEKGVQYKHQGKTLHINTY